MNLNEASQKALEIAEKKYCKGCKLRMEQCLWAWRNTNGLNELKNCSCKEVPAYIRGAEFGYNKAKEEIYSLFDFVIQYENGKYKCTYKSGKVFESVDGEIWKENYNSKREQIKVEK